MARKGLIPVLLVILALAVVVLARRPAATPGVSGIDPRLTYSNREGECGTGAVVPWADRLWVITYGPHLPAGSSDKLWEISPDLSIRARPESVGGTPANRMIHRESNQLLIGPYVIDASGNVRVIPPSRMFGRLTGTARHLNDPANKVYYATMEEGLYEVDVRTLAVRTLIRDSNLSDPDAPKPKPKPGEKPQENAWDKIAAPENRSAPTAKLPGYHGKGLHTGQGRVVYANNGDQNPRVTTDPTVPSGALAEWKGEGNWSLVRRNQFTEVTGPGGIEGNLHPETDPIWSMGWDAKSLILMVLDGGKWHPYRLPKPSHSYDGAHGWNTEWPRIRDIGEEDLLMTMHGAFWRFPRDFRPSRSGGIAPRSAYLKVVGDFCRWRDHIVLGCDDSARAEFLNERPMKVAGATPPESNSNLWFLRPEQLDSLGPVIARGSVWLREDLAAGTTSDPFLFSGFEHRGLHLAHTSDAPVRFALSIDRMGDGTWSTLREVTVPAGSAAWIDLRSPGAWIRLTALDACTGASASFHYRHGETPKVDNSLLSGLAKETNTDRQAGALRSLGADRLGMAKNGRLYTVDKSLRLAPSDDPQALAAVTKGAPRPMPAVLADAASIILTEDGRRWRLPFGTERRELGSGRICREVATERDLLNVGGTFFELPARNAQGMAKVRAVSTHGLAIEDYCSQFGLLFMTGTEHPAKPGRHLLRSDDGEAAVWVGAVDDLWRFGAPRGQGGPWKDSAVKAGQPSDPYLMSGYSRMSATITSDTTGTVRLEVDIDGTGLWVPWRTFKTAPGETIEHAFPEGFGAYWVRAIADRDMRATVQLEYR